jgi:hypothetical protein
MILVRIFMLDDENSKLRPNCGIYTHRIEDDESPVADVSNEEAWKDWIRREFRGIRNDIKINDDDEEYQGEFRFSIHLAFHNGDEGRGTLRTVYLFPKSKKIKKDGIVEGV